MDKLIQDDFIGILTYTNVKIFDKTHTDRTLAETGTNEAAEFWLCFYTIEAYSALFFLFRHEVSARLETRCREVTMSAYRNYDCRSLQSS